MKTKIVYISGNEVFEMADIRAAFDSVRDALGLDKETVLFGVPVDEDDALANITTKPETVVLNTKPAPVVEPTPVVTDVVTPEPVAEEPVKEDKPKAQKKGRTRRTAKAEPVETIETPEPADTAEKVVPILSVLGAQSTDTDEALAEPTDTESVPAPQQVSIDEPIDEPVPEPDEAEDNHPEKKLVELLDSMAPLREDIISDDISTTDTEISDDADTATSTSDDYDDTDETLAKLASEFAKSEDKIAPAPKSSARGKISKLKNILPFKKVRHDDSGLMGDLFGWAGMAANDDEFTMPGFFTGAGGKK